MRSTPYRKTMAARALALAASLETGLQFALSLDIPPQNPAVGSRLLPDTHSKSIIHSEYHLGGTTLQLDAALQLGVNGLSQVWTAHPIDAPQTTLVMKIIQPSLCRWPIDDWWNDYRDPWHLAHNEAWVYRCLVEKQGLIVPYFFGLHTITTPSQETAWVLVLEFIPGQTVDEVVISRSMPTMREFCLLGIAAAQDLARSGWMLPYIRGPNVLLTGAPGNWTVVFIDLFEAARLDPVDLKDSAYVETAARVQTWSFFSAFCECTGRYFPGSGFGSGLQRHYPLLFGKDKYQL
ncbi:hypothetical protein B0H16DRAFT_846424 [Mycena metata]|uniref:Aminoglycoside phosphotransferase domain-containing protein n=1 Tax=Mycena metata TaxID=1033252 RepID=A0AAD7N914_9AGAR|nr:hypothetical protein B0H16DRAFT_846424 [Mycena metata]